MDRPSGMGCVARLSIDVFDAFLEARRDRDFNDVCRLIRRDETLIFCCTLDCGNRYKDRTEKLVTMIIAGGRDIHCRGRPTWGFKYSFRVEIPT